MACRRSSRLRRRFRKSRRLSRRKSRKSSRRKSRKSRRSSRRKSRKTRRSRRSGRPMDLNKYKPERGCTRQTTKKYTSRPSPPFAANLCRDKKLKGNDGKMYASVRAKNRGKNFYKWVKI